MPTFPAKTNYLSGDILTAAQMVDIGNGLNDLLPDAKGSLTTVSAANTPAQLTAGANGETLVADSSASTGLRWQGNFAAGKNKIINGDFAINQRAFTSTTANATYGFDRWISVFADGTNTYSAQTFTLGAAPVAGYEAKNFAQLVSSGQTATTAVTALSQRIESVRTFAGQTVTVSFWAKAATGTPNIAVWFAQVFGTGGSPSSAVDTGTTKRAISTSWARYSFVLTLPSISGKTLGTNNDDSLRLFIATSAGTDRNAYTDSLGIQSATIDIWGVQVEAGNVATAFQTATGTLAGELAACQRYYYRAVTPENAYGAFGTGMGRSGTTAYGLVPLPVPMRISPTSIEYSAVRIDDGSASTGSATSITINSLFTSRNLGALDMTFSSGVTQYRPYVMEANNSTAAYVAFSAEL